MTLENLIGKGLQQEPASPEELRRFLNKIATKLADAQSETLSLDSRFDLAYDGTTPPKMLEYNADTPTTLIEAAVAQWNWKQDVHPNADQFNSLHEALVGRLKEIKERYKFDTLHMGCLTESQEDVGNLEYMLDVAVQAGLNANLMDMSEVGLETLKDGVRFVDMH